MNYTLMTTSVFATSGTWIKPIGSSYVDVLIIGGGGGGKNGAPLTFEVGDGGYPSYVNKINKLYIGNQTYITVTVGAKGIHGLLPLPTAGGNSFFGTYIATGGYAGSNLTYDSTISNYVVNPLSDCVTTFSYLSQMCGGELVTRGGIGGTTIGLSFPIQKPGDPFQNPFLAYGLVITGIYDNYYGIGGKGGIFYSGGNAAGSNGNNYGSGGGGGAVTKLNGAGNSGGDGAPGIVVVKSFKFS